MELKYASNGNLRLLFPNSYGNTICHTGTLPPFKTVPDTLSVQPRKHTIIDQ